MRARRAVGALIDFTPFEGCSLTSSTGADDLNHAVEVPKAKAGLGFAGTIEVQGSR